MNQQTVVTLTGEGRFVSGKDLNSTADELDHIRKIPRSLASRYLR
jgi:hypothetical protein